MYNSDQLPPPSPPAATTGRRWRPDAETAPWTVGDIFVVFVLWLFLTVVAGTGMSDLLAERVPEAVLTALYGPLTLLVLGLTTLGWAAARHRSGARMLLGPRRPRAVDLAVGVGLGIGAVIVITAGLGLALVQLLEALELEVPNVQEQLRETARDPSTVPIFVVSALVIAPVCEEVFFRGLLFPAIARRLGVWVGIVLSAVVFGLVHLNQAGDLVGGAVLLARLLPLGIVFAWLYHWRGTLVVPIVVHSVFNGASVVMLLAGWD